MKIYDLLMKPLEKHLLKDIRKQVVSKAAGNVLELGIGTGINIQYYDKSKVNALTCLDMKLNRGIIKIIDGFECNYVEGNAENLPFPDNHFDSVVATLLLCSVADTGKAIYEIKRVLKPEGNYIFIEHIAPEDKKLLKVFNAANRIWPKLANGCNLNKRTDIAIQGNDFDNLEMAKKGNNIFCYGVGQKKTENS